MFTIVRHCISPCAGLIQAYTLTPCFSKIHYLRICLLRDLFLLGYKNEIYVYNFPHACCILHPSQPPVIDHANNIRCAEVVANFFIVLLSPVFCYVLF
jgi:hypothetical protein